MEIKEFLKNHFSIDDKLNKFNNSELISMNYRYTRKKCYIPGFLGEAVYFPYQVSDKEIADAVKSIVNVPFIISVGRETDNKIYAIVVSRVFI